MNFNFIRFLVRTLTVSCCLIGLWTNNSTAQVLNADGLIISVDSTDRFNGKLNAGVSVLKQKSTYLTITSGVDLSYLLSQNHQFILSGRYYLFREDGDNLINTGFIHLRYRGLIDRWYNPEVFLQGQLATVIGMRERYLAGANMRFRLWKKEKSEAYFGLGAMAEKEIWSDSGVGEDVEMPYNTVCRTSPCTTDLIKLNQYFSIDQQLSKTTKFTLIVYYQAIPDVNYFEPRVAGDTSISVEIVKNLKLKMQFDWIYDADPVFPIDNFYYTFTNGLTLSL